MSTNITTAFVQQYSANVQMLSQQMGSLLRDKVRVESVVGKNAFFDQVGSVTAVEKTSRHSDTPQIDTPHARRRVSLADYEFADLIDQQDKVRLLIDPTSSYAQDGIALGVGKDVNARIDERSDKSYATQVYYCMSIGATRMEEAKVVEVQCTES